MTRAGYGPTVQLTMRNFPYKIWNARLMILERSVFNLNKVMYWNQALTHKEIRMMCRQSLAQMGVKTGNCPKGYEEFDCKCYKDTR